MQTLTNSKIEKSKNRNLEDKLIIITGAGRGLGKQMAIDLASRGANLILTYGNSKESAEALAKEVESIGQKAVAVQLKLGKLDSIKEFVSNLEKSLEHFGRKDFDVLINNAGIIGNATFGDMTEEAFDELYDINVKAVFFTIKESHKLIKDGGSIINLSSSLTNHSYGFVDSMVYSSTKGAINILTRDFAVMFGPRNIRVNAVAPGATYTDMTSDFLDNPELAAQFKEITSLKRIGQPEDISPVVAFLASDDSKWVTGEIFETSGGAHL